MTVRSALWRGSTVGTAAVLLATATAPATAGDEPGFVSLFDVRSLAGRVAVNSDGFRRREGRIAHTGGPGWPLKGDPLPFIEGDGLLMLRDHGAPCLFDRKAEGHVGLQGEHGQLAWRALGIKELPSD